MGWPANAIRPVANSDFLKANPAAAELLRQVQVPIADIFAQNAEMNAGADSPQDLEQQASEWIEENRDDVDTWLQKARWAATM